MSNTTDTGFDFGPAYHVAGYDGIAFRADAYETETIGEWRLWNEDEDADPDDESSYDWEEEERLTGMILAHMIGDDRTFVLDPDDMTPIGDDDYCAGCGQIGCGWC